MTPLEILAAAGLVSALLAVGYIVIAGKPTGSALVAATLSGMFAGFTAITIWSEGVVLVWTNHTTNLWGVQVWWDLLFAIGIGLFLIAPRARRVGMNLPLWTLFVIATASIGLLAMCARLFVLERAAAGKDA